MAAYYNEIDPKAAAWLRELIKRGQIADGEVDTRSIIDVRSDDLREFRQCHFFAGIGGWSYALRIAGWADDREVWTGSCPCQPFSVAGASEGTGDPRHLWPAWFRLIAERRPTTVFGEQVASADGLYWLDLVYADLEASDYAVGAFDLPAASVGAPHGRQRLWVVADNHGEGRDRIEAARLHGRRPGARGDESPAGNADGARGDDVVRRGRVGNVADAKSGGQRADGRTPGQPGHVDSGGEAGALGDSKGAGQQGRRRGWQRGRPVSDGSSELVYAGGEGLEGYAGHGVDWHESGRVGAIEAGSAAAASGVSFWSGCDWIPCIDGKARPVEPGSFPLAHGISARVGRLRGYGNAIVPEVAAEIIRAYMEVS